MSTTSSTAEARSSRRWLALGVIAAAQFMVIMDTSIIGVALPKMQHDLGFTPQGLSWVFNAYVVAFGGLLLLGGRLSDLFGARRIFSLGWVVLAAGSLMAGFAGNVPVELAGRAVQGAGSALIAPAALTLLFMTFGSSPKELTKALALYGAAAPAGGTAGVFLGGVLTEYASWPWVFFINVPLAVIVVAVTRSVMPAGMTRRGSLDITSAATVTAGLAAVVFAVVRAPQAGWTSASTLTAGLGGLALLGLFVAMQARLREPLMRLGIFTAPNLAASNAAQFLLGAAWIPMFFFLNLYLQQVLGLGAFASGAALLPLTVTIMVGMIVRRPAPHRPLRSEGDDRRRARDPGRRPGLAVVHPPRRQLHRRRAARQPRRRRRHGDGVHPLPRHGAVLGGARGGRPRCRHRQHQLPGRLRPRAGRDDRGRHRVRCRPDRERRSPYRRVLRRAARCRRHRRRRRRPRLGVAADPAGDPRDVRPPTPGESEHVAA